MSVEDKPSTGSVLIVEDNLFLSEMYALKLESENFEVFLTDNGHEALEKMRIHQPDIVLLDLLMPGKDGFEVLEEKFKDSKIKDIPLIVLTNLSEKDKIKKCYDLGADDFLIKAYFVPSEVVKKIKNLINK